MTTTAFAPSAFQLFSFRTTLDGRLYSVGTTWNVYRQGWYINVYDQTNALVVARPLVAEINLVFGYFQTSTLIFHDITQAFEVLP